MTYFRKFFFCQPCLYVPQSPVSPTKLASVAIKTRNHRLFWALHMGLKLINFLVFTSSGQLTAKLQVLWRWVSLKGIYDLLPRQNMTCALLWVYCVCILCIRLAWRHCYFGMYSKSMNTNVFQLKITQNRNFQTYFTIFFRFSNLVSWYTMGSVL
jgi:hypothetical protein